MAVLSASRPAWVVDGVDEGEIGERRKGRKLWKTRVRNVRVVVQIEMGECREIVQLPQPHVRQAGAAVESSSVVSAVRVSSPTSTSVR